MKHVCFFAAAAVCAALVGCGSKAEEPLDPAPIVQLQGSWQMINRIATCESSYTLITPNAIVKVSESGPRKKYANIHKFALGPGKVILGTTGLHRDPQRELSLHMEVGERFLRVTELTGSAGESYKNPPKEIEADEANYMKALYRINEQRFSMDKCAGA
jgi:hypothetical protein